MQEVELTFTLGEALQSDQVELKYYHLNGELLERAGFNRTRWN